MVPTAYVKPATDQAITDTDAKQTYVCQFAIAIVLISLQLTCLKLNFNKYVYAKPQ